MHLFTLILLILTGVVSPWAMAADPEPPKDATYQARPRLVSEDSVLRPGQTHWLGLHFEMQDGWHIYWPGLNDSGFAPELEISVEPAEIGSEPVKVGQILWPAPSRYFPAEGILDHIYEDQVTLLIPITLPASMPSPSGEITVRVVANWLVCKEQCIPEDTDLSLTLRVSTDRMIYPPTGDAPLFTQARQRHPEPWPPGQGARGLEATWQGNTLVLTARRATRMAFYPSEDSARPLNLKDQGETSGTELRIDFSPGTEPVRGVLEVWAPQGVASAGLFVVELNR